MAKRKILKDITITEISAVDRPAQAGARAVLMKRGPDPSLGKRRSLLTSVGGHAHILAEEDFDGRIIDAGETSYAVSEGADVGHTHPWIRRDDGTILIGEAEGHTHEIQATTKRAEGDDPMPKTTEELQKELEAKQAELDKANKAKEAEIAKLQAERDEAQAIAKMSDKERKAMDEMDDEDKKKFLKADQPERDRIIAKRAEADPVVYTASDGTEYRKSDGRLADFAKRDDERSKEMAKARQEAQDARIEKRISAEFPNFGKAKAKAAAVLLKAVEAVEDEALRKECDELLKAAHAALDRFTKMDGHRGGETDPSVVKAAGDFQTKVQEIRKRDECTHQEAMRKARIEHPELFKAFQGEQGSASAAA